MDIQIKTFRFKRHVLFRRFVLFQGFQFIKFVGAQIRQLGVQIDALDFRHGRRRRITMDKRWSLFGFGRGQIQGFRRCFRNQGLIVKFRLKRQFAFIKERFVSRLGYQGFSMTRRCEFDVVLTRCIQA
ncbi:hypothetical protein E2H98_07195 [Permianibacter aggregans]|nr:hypothetical protein E2H98_07195 [Permianibacter aggregans]